MKRIYDTGLDNNHIQLEVKIGTVGVGYTAAYVFRTGGQWTKLLESDEESGNIPLSEIGTASFLRKAYIIVRTMIDFSHLPENERDLAVRTISAQYDFKGGFSGYQQFNFDLDDITVTPNKKLASIIKPIEML